MIESLDILSDEYCKAFDENRKNGNIISDPNALQGTFPYNEEFTDL
jgi:hypothetical protein